MKRSIPAFVLAALMALTAPADAKPLSGAVSTDGSTSMEKVIGSLGEAFGNAHPNVKVTYNPTGSGAGITAVMEGRCDIGLASRGLKEKEIVSNLCDNAIKYNVEGGTISMALARHGGRARITVADSGIGIPREEQERIFERFYRVDKSHSRSTEGSGLGLSIVKHAVQHIGAEIDVESSPGKGSKFSITFPLH